MKTAGTSMLFALFAFVLCVSEISCNVGGNQHCADLNPQPHVSIEQLMGMWYGIEVIWHKRDGFEFANYTNSCPVLHFFEDNTPSSTFSPLYTNYNYEYNYGTGYDNSGNYYQQRRDQYQTTTPSRLHTSYRYPKHRQLKFKHLKLWWVEYDNGVEYSLKYNDTRPGFWITSGPHNGSSLLPKFDHFAGNIQVLKAVGSHLVLTFCFQMPDEQLYSVVLAREYKLGMTEEIHGVRNLFINRGLDVRKSKRLCLVDGAASVSVTSGSGLILAIVISILYTKLSTIDS